jgi:hypothetical protein
MLDEPWISFILLFAAAGGIIAVALGHTWFQDRAAARRARDASAHPAE